MNLELIFWIKLLYDKGRIIFDLYTKPTNSGRYLNLFSNHPTIHKRGVVITLFDKIIFLSHPRFHHPNIESLINTLLRNGYPLQFVFKTIKNRIKTLSRKKNFNTTSEQNINSNGNSSVMKKYFTIPYLNNTSERFNIALKKISI